MTSPTSPYERKANVLTVQDAQKLYAELGSLLMASKSVQRQKDIDKTWRKEAVQVRRELIDEYGSMVRARQDQYEARHHVTVPKPSEYAPPYVTVIYYDPRRGEVRRVLQLSNKKDREDFLRLFKRMVKEGVELPLEVEKIRIEPWIQR